MSNWYDEAQRRLEHKQQQEQQQRVQALQQQKAMAIIYLTNPNSCAILHYRRKHVGQELRTWQTSKQSN